MNYRTNIFLKYFADYLGKAYRGCLDMLAVSFEIDHFAENKEHGLTV